jgi:hypothetical protein
MIGTPIQDRSPGFCEEAVRLLVSFVVIDIRAGADPPDDASSTVSNAGTPPEKPSVPKANDGQTLND